MPAASSGLTDAEERELLALLEAEYADRARSSLLDYCRQITIPGAPINDDPECEEFYPVETEPAAHHRVMLDALQRIESGEVRRVMLFLPPGSAKSSYASVVFPTWFMGRKRGRNVICVSYGSELATRFGRRCRAICRSPAYRRIFGAELVADNRAADDWSLTNGSTYMAGGVMSGITGNRADGLVIDDPLRGRADADSATIREKTWQEYATSLLTRLKPRGFVLLIMTRWHEEDLAGRILPADWQGESGWVTARDGERWWVVRIPAQADAEDDPMGRAPGEWLWPEWKPVEEWEQTKRTQLQEGGARNWSALYQQRPTPQEGGIVKRAWLRQSWTALPDETAQGFAGRLGLNCFQSWDTAQSEKRTSDWTVGQVWGVKWPAVYLLDQVRARMDIPDVLRAVEAMSAKWPTATLKLIEERSSGSTVVQMLRSRLGGLLGVHPKDGKLARMRAVTPLLEAGNVWLPPPALAPWLGELIEELAAFTGNEGDVDDQCDALSQALARVATMAAPLAGAYPRSTGSDSPVADLIEGR